MNRMINVVGCDGKWFDGFNLADMLTQVSDKIIKVNVISGKVRISS